MISIKRPRWAKKIRGRKDLPSRALIASKDIIWNSGWWLKNVVPGAIKRRVKRLCTRRSYSFDKVASRYRRVSFCTTCMGRLEHIKKTLLKNIRDNDDYPDIEFVLLDYNSNDGLEQWVREHCARELASGRLVYYQTKKPDHFHMARAKNIAHDLATGEILCNVDADNFTGKDFAYYINSVFDREPRSLLVHDLVVKGCGGRIVISADDFRALGGYNEIMTGWGYEDRDFILRAERLGLKESVIPAYFLNTIRHGDGLRVRNTPSAASLKKTLNDNRSISNADQTIVHIDNPPYDPTEFKRLK